MEEITLSNHILTDAVLIPGIFIEHYMPKATGEQVKVYLYLLRQISSPSFNFSLKTLATALFMEENDVRRALSYWEKQKLLQVEVNDFIVTGITFLPFPTTPAQTVAATVSFPFAPPPSTGKSNLPVKDSIPEPAKAKAVAPSKEINPTPEEGIYSTIPWDELEKDTDYQVLLRSAQAYLSTTLKPSDCDRIAYWYILFERSSDIVEYLIEYCADLNKTSFRYMEKVALDWHKHGLKTLPQVKEYSKGFLPSYNAIMRGMGIKDRNMNTKESDFLKKWTANYHFSAEILQYACEQTLEAIHKPSFEYADKKLTHWFELGLNTLEAIQKDEQQYRSNNAKSKKPSPKTASPNNQSYPKNKGQFFNFDQRDTDYNEYFKDFYAYGETSEEET